MGAQQAMGAQSRSSRHASLGPGGSSTAATCGGASTRGGGAGAVGRATAASGARLCEHARVATKSAKSGVEGIMPSSHTIAEGDCCSSLAAAAGLLDHHAVYDHGDNAELKSRRPNANMLVVGDVVSVPDVETKTLDAATTRRHRYVVTVRAVKLRLKIVDREGHAVSGKAWRLVFAGGQRDGALGGDGKIEVELPATVSSATLTLDPDAPPPEPQPPAPPPPAPAEDPANEPYPPAITAADHRDQLDAGYVGAALLPVQWSLTIGGLPSPNEVVGAQERLVNLGAWIEGERGAPDVWTRAAVKAFQKRSGQSETGEAADVTDATRDAHDTF